MSLLVTDLDGKNLDSPMGHTQEIILPLDTVGTFPFVLPGQQYKYSNNRSIVVAAVLDSFKGAHGLGNFILTMGSVASLVSGTGDWMTQQILGTGALTLIIPFGLYAPLNIIPVYTSDGFDFSAQILSTNFMPAGSTCRAYLIGVSY